MHLRVIKFSLSPQDGVAQMIYFIKRILLQVRLSTTKGSKRKQNRVGVANCRSCRSGILYITL
jgi:hypothetical protein